MFLVLNLKLAGGFLLLITPIAPLVGITASPSLAATFANSEAILNINNLSHTTLDVVAFTETDDDKVVNDGVVNTEFDAVASFRDGPPPFVENSSFSTVDGVGSDYSGMAQSAANTTGYNFLVNSGETFSFNFDVALNLNTSIDNPQLEAATSTGNIALELYDTTNGDNWTQLGSFTLLGELSSLGNNDYLNLDKSGGIISKPSGASFNADYKGNQETAELSTEGSFSRTFENLTSITLVADQANEVTVSVPEPSTILGLLLGIIGMGYRITSKAFNARSTQK